jgi:diguanylate cyclase (GGDEF)-like protein/PAS domain S-box-containing protein
MSGRGCATDARESSPAAAAHAARLAAMAGIGSAAISGLDAPIELCPRAADLFARPRTLAPRLALRALDAPSRRALIGAVRHAANGRPAQARIRALTPEGDHRHADVRLAPDGDGRLLAAITDRTDDRLLIGSLIEQIDHLWHTVELNPQLPWLAEAGRGITRVTDRYLQMVGLSRDEALGFTGWMKVLHPDDIERMQLAIGEAMLKGERIDLRVRLRAATGEYRWVRTQAFPRRGKDGQILQWYGYTEDIHDIVLAEIETRWAAEHDPLTGLPNRALFNRRLDDVIGRAQRDLSRVGLVMLDLDNFKDVNDIFGHDAGDGLLRQFGRILRESIFVEATIARLGGDEFAILLPNLSGPEVIDELIGAIFAELKTPMRIDGREFDCRASAGWAIYPLSAGGASELFKHADIALYEAKNSGRGRYLGFEPSMKNAMQRRVAMINIGREAVENHRLMPYYQPQVSLETGEIVGFETLLRRRDRNGQICLPGSIAEAFNDFEVAEAIGIAMLDLVIADMIDWRARGLPFGKVSINASAAEFRNRDFINRLTAHTDGAGIPHDQLVIEVTECVFVGRSAPMVGDMIAELKSAGFGISLDDFGTGYASLAHLRQIPVDMLKIDRSFIGDLFPATGHDSAAIVSAIIRLSKGLGMTVVAEGIETQRQAQFLREQGCAIGQGYLFGRPAPKSVVDQMLVELRRAG